MHLPFKNKNMVRYVIKILENTRTLKKLRLEGVMFAWSPNGKLVINIFHSNECHCKETQRKNMFSDYYNHTHTKMTIEINFVFLLWNHYWIVFHSAQHPMRDIFSPNSFITLHFAYHTHLTVILDDMATICMSLYLDNNCTACAYCSYFTYLYNISSTLV